MLSIFHCVYNLKYMERVYYLTDSFMSWLAKKDRGLYENMLKQAESAETRRYGNSVSFERGTALKFSDERDSQNFGAVLHKATLLWVNEENNIGFPKIPEKAQSSESIFLSNTFVQWLHENRPEVLEKIESCIKDTKVQKINFGEEDSPIVTGFYLVFLKAEDRELLGDILHRAVLEALSQIKYVHIGREINLGV